MKKYITIAIIIILSFAALSMAEPGKVDRAGFRSDAKIGVDYDHHENHEKNVYSAAYNATLATGAAITFLMNTPELPTLGHFICTVRSSGESNIRFYEDVVVSAVGTDMQETNHNRSAPVKVAKMEVTRAPTVTSLGTELEGYQNHVGAGQTRGGEARGMNELIMDASSLYIVNTVSEANSNDVTLHCGWYEDSGDAP